jgi:hypothetical protein
VASVLPSQGQLFPPNPPAKLYNTAENRHNLRKLKYFHEIEFFNTYSDNFQYKSVYIFPSLYFPHFNYVAEKVDPGAIGLT